MGVIVKIKRQVKLAAIPCIIFLILLIQFNYSHGYAYKETAVPEPVKLSPRLQALFKKTKILCFGRYAIEVPQEAQIIFGRAILRSEVDLLPGGFEKVRHNADEEIAKLKRANDSADITYNGPGPINDSWQVRYYEDKLAKKYELYFFTTYVSKGGFTFVLGDATSKGETENTVIVRQLTQAMSLRLRNEEEVPTEPGFCIKHGFLVDDQYAYQEMINAGIYLPSLPDVTFSISSNKDAYADYDKTEFGQMKRDQLPLLARIKQAQKTQGALYPKRDVLREGKRDVQHWNGEESLILSLTLSICAPWTEGT